MQETFGTDDSNSGVVPGVLLAGAASAVQGDDLLSADARFTDGTLLPAGPHLQPLGGQGRATQWVDSLSKSSVVKLCVFFVFQFGPNLKKRLDQSKDARDSWTLLVH